MTQWVDLDESISTVGELLQLWRELGEFTRPLWRDGEYIAFNYRGPGIGPEEEARYLDLRDRITRLYAGVAGVVRAYGGTTNRIMPGSQIMIRNYDPIAGIFSECPDLRSLCGSLLAPGQFKMMWNTGYQILNTCLGALEAAKRRPPSPADAGESASRQKRGKPARPTAVRRAHNRLTAWLNWTERNVMVRWLIVIGGAATGILVLLAVGRMVLAELRHVPKQSRGGMVSPGHRTDSPAAAPVPTPGASPSDRSGSAPRSSGSGRRAGAGRDRNR
jgi:hypothetical protein